MDDLNELPYPQVLNSCSGLSLRLCRCSAVLVSISDPLFSVFFSDGRHWHYNRQDGRRGQAALHPISAVSKSFGGENWTVLVDFLEALTDGLGHHHFCIHSSTSSFYFWLQVVWDWGRVWRPSRSALPCWGNEVNLINSWRLCWTAEEPFHLSEFFFLFV